MSRSSSSHAVALILLAFAAVVVAAERSPLSMALDEMAAKGAAFDAQKMHALGESGLAGVLDFLFEFKGPSGPTEEQIRRLIAQLDDDDFQARERVTAELIRSAAPHRLLIEEAVKSDRAEIRVRAQRILEGLVSQPVVTLNSYLSGFWVYVQGIHDTEQLALLARRTVKALESGLPDGDRLHLTRLCIAAVARGHEETSCAIFLPLLKHQDKRVAVFVTETFGGYLTEPKFFPQLLADALASDRPAVVETALRFTTGCQDPKRREQVQQSLRTIFLGDRESLKFQACSPLMRDFQDVEAWEYVLRQTQAKDRDRAKTALAWISDAGQRGQPAPPHVLKLLLPMLRARDGALRQAAAQAIGGFAGEEVVRNLIPLLGDAQATIKEQAAANLLEQPDSEMVRRLLTDAAWKYPDEKVRAQARQLLAKMKQS
jgi:hypothetical protein